MNLWAGGERVQSSDGWVTHMCLTVSGLAQALGVLTEHWLQYAQRPDVLHHLGDL